MKFGDRFSNLLVINCVKFYPDLFRFGISIVQWLGVYFYGHSVFICLFASRITEKLKTDLAEIFIFHERLG